VTRCWGFSEYDVNWTGASGLKDYTIPVVDKIKKGDLWWSSGYVFLQDTDNMVYEANPTSDPDSGQRVQERGNPYPFYEKRSIFPQFSKMKPEDGDMVDVHQKPPRISLVAKGSGLISGVRM